ncbi:MAG: invasion associated locus B family protein [Pseudomonadota bacterium]
MRRLLAAALLALTPGLGSGAATAQSAANGAQFGDWTLRCVAEGVGETSCALIQRLAQAETNAFVAEVGLNVVEAEDGRRTLMILLTPEGTALSLRPAYVVDQSGDQVALNWRTCAKGVCRAAAVLTLEQETALMTGRRITLAYQFSGRDAPLRATLSLSGVTAGLAALREE